MFKNIKKHKKIIKKISAGVVLLILIISSVYYFLHRKPLVHYKTPEEASNIYVRFDMEAYDKIAENYWEASTTYNLPLIFQASAQKLTGSLLPLVTTDRVGVAKMLSIAFATSSTAIKKSLAVATLNTVLNNLRPFGRSQLYTSQNAVAMRQEVSNVNPSTDLYKDLGVASSSSTTEVKKAFEQQIAVLKNATTTEAKAKVVEVTHAYNVLSNPNTRTLYTSTKVEPVATNNIYGKTLYVSLSKMSPTVVQEFAWDVDSASTTPNLDSMIIDLRGNIGGSTDVARALTGLFIGNNQYAFDLFHQGDYQPQRTMFGKFAELKRFHDIAVLTDRGTQSTAEVFTEILTHFNLAHAVGQTTAGWGTVENTYPLQTVIDPNDSYTLYLVNSITLRGDGQPIQGRGVDPDVDVTQADWKKQLGNSFSSASLVKTVETMVQMGPLRQ